MVSGGVEPDQQKHTHKEMSPSVCHTDPKVHGSECIKAVLHPVKANGALEQTGIRLNKNT